MTHRIYIDGDQGTTGLQIVQSAARRGPDLQLLTLPEAQRKDPQQRAEMLNACDIALLCLPDAAAREAVSWVHEPAGAHPRREFGAPCACRLGLRTARAGRPISHGALRQRGVSAIRAAIRPRPSRCCGRCATRVCCRPTTHVVVQALFGLQRPRARRHRGPRRRGRRRPAQGLTAGLRRGCGRMTAHFCLRRPAPPPCTRRNAVRPCSRLSPAWPCLGRLRQGSPQAATAAAGGDACSPSSRATCRSRPSTSRRRRARRRSTSRRACRGFLDKRVYTEGAVVKAGQVLFRMDQKPFQAQVDGAGGGAAAQPGGARQWRTPNLDAHQAARRSRTRCRRRTWTTRTGQYEQAAAAVAQAKAQLEYGAAQPLVHDDHLAGRRRQQLRGGGRRHLPQPAEQPAHDGVGADADVGQLQPLRERDAAHPRPGRRRACCGCPKDSSFVVEIELVDGTLFPYKGRITFADPSYNSQTGTFLIRATVDNPKGVLRPNQYVRARLQGAIRPNAILVPQRAVQQGAKGHFVWVVNKDGKAELRPVVVGDWYGDGWFIAQGLRPATRSSSTARCGSRRTRRSRRRLRAEAGSPSRAVAPPGDAGRAIRDRQGTLDAEALGCSRASRRHEGRPNPIDVTGFADRTGNRAANVELAKRRATPCATRCRRGHPADRVRLKRRRTSPAAAATRSAPRRDRRRQVARRMFSRFFIERPIFAAVVSIIIVPRRPGRRCTCCRSQQYPTITPVQVTVSATYPGADSKTLADSVAAPIEAQINGVDNMLYMSSTSSSTGQLTLTVYFSLDTDPDIAQVQVQNRVNLALPQLPSAVTQHGVSVQKKSSSIMMLIARLRARATATAPTTSPTTPTSTCSTR